jgi:hypothetical protein
VKPVGVSKFFCFSDASGTSQGPRNEGYTMTSIGERATHVVAFNNLGDDSSSDIRGVPSPRETEEMPPPPPSFMPS